MQVSNDNLLGTIVNNGRFIPYIPPREIQTPEVLIVLTKDTTITMSNRHLVFGGVLCSNTQGPVSIPFFGIQGPVSLIGCENAQKKKLRLTCYERPCAENTWMSIAIASSLDPFNQRRYEYQYKLAFDENPAEGCEKTCAEKVAEFVASANAAYPESPVVFSVDPSNTSRLFIEAKVAGEDFLLQAYEGFNSLTTVTQSKREILKGKHLKGFGVESCVATDDCADDVCLKTIQFECLFQVRMDTPDDSSTSSGSIGGNYLGKMKRVMIIARGDQAQALAKFDDVEEILSGGRDLSEYISVWNNPITYPPAP